MFGQYGILFIKVNLRLNCFIKIEKNASGTTPFLKLHFVVSANDFLPAVSLIQKNTRDPFHKYIVFQQAVRIGVYPQPYTT